jgi:hypothetical protein
MKTINMNPKTRAEQDAQITNYIKSIDTKQLKDLIKEYEDRANDLLEDKAYIINDYKRIVAYLEEQATPEHSFDNEADYFTYQYFIDELNNNQKIFQGYINDLKIIRADYKLRTKQEQANTSKRGR